MRISAGSIAIVILATGLLAGLGGYVGVSLGLRHTRPGGDLDRVLHEELGLTPDQRGQLAGLEHQFDVVRARQEARMRAANRDLAAALAADHALTARAKAAIQHFHIESEAMQEATIAHVLQMRGILTPQQTQHFDRAVSEALAPPPP